MAKLGLWIKALLATINDSWVHLDLYQFERFLRLLHATLEETFKKLRLCGWPLAEAKAIAEILATLNSIPMSLEGVKLPPTQGVFSHVLRIFWRALMPQLELRSPPA